MEKRLIAAITLSILIIIIFQGLFPSAKKTQPVIQKVSRTPVEEEIVPKESFQVSKKEEITYVETERYILTFTNIGASLKDIKLKEYPGPQTGSALTLVKDAGLGEAIFSMKSNTLTSALDKREFELQKRGRDRLVYAYTIPGKFRVTKEYRFHNINDYIELRILIQNLSQDTIFKNYDLLGSSGLQQSGKTMGRRFLEINSMVDGRLVRNTRVKNGELFVPGIISWTGVKERYFCIILKPFQDSEGIVLKQFSKSNLASGIRTKRTPIYPGSSVEDSYILYIGPNDVTRLNKLGFGLEQIVNYGVFGGISKMLLVVLRTFHRVAKNWGVAIIMLTFVVNIILFPLTRKSFLSMRKIQEIQPHIEKLRKVHKDNPQKLNKELAELYRQYNVNPFGGCLPLLIQMPIFIALYQGLIRSIELKGANFLWIKDLSRPDFVSIPFKLPLLGDQIHILPLLMVVAMFIQQKISMRHTPIASKEQRQQQSFMLFFFPVFFGFIFYSFPSGLVLYWLTNTILMSIEHTTMRKLV